MLAQFQPNSYLSGVQLSLKTASGATVLAGPIGSAPTPLPTPNQGQAGDTYVAAPVPALSPGTMYTVVVTGTETFPNPCGGTALVSIGPANFTTQ